MEILLLTIGGIGFFALLIWLLSFYWRRVVDQNIMVHFRAAEAITENGQLPNEWISDINRRASSLTSTWFGLRKLSHIDLVLAKLDGTTHFFEEGSFYADNNAKRVLLAELADTRKRIESMTWEEIVLEQNQIRDL